MPRTKIDKDVRRNILEARRMVQEIKKADANEPETRQRVERIFESLMGYDALKHLSRELAVRGTGISEHVDFAIKLEGGKDEKPKMIVEIKRVGIDLSAKHLRQAANYAINKGSEWMLLTNSREWQLYHVSFEQPPDTKLIHSWDLLKDDHSTLAQRFGLISLRSLRKGTLEDVWQKTNVLHPRNLLQAILSENSIRNLRRDLRRDSGVLLSPEDIVSGIRRLLNEGALKELEEVRISLTGRRPKRRKRKPKETPEETSVSEVPDTEGDEESQ